MVLEFVHHSSDYWSPFAEKVIFDGTLKTITITPGTTELDIRADLYSAWIWWISLRDNSKYLYAMRFTGLDPIGDIYIGDIYFLINGWKLIIDLTKVRIFGVLYSDNYPTAYYDANLNPQYPATVSSLVNTVTLTQNVVTGDISSIPTAEENALATWQKAIEGLTAEQMLKVMLAALAGKTTGIGTNLENYNAQDGSTPRLTVEFDGNGNRINTTINGA